MLSAHLQLLALTLALAPSLASAAIFPSNTHVKMLDMKGFKKAMKTNVGFFFFELVTILAGLFMTLPQATSVVAFVAPWCGVRLISSSMQS
jgi:protein disulfide-isomerase A6